MHFSLLFCRALPFAFSLTLLGGAALAQSEIEPAKVDEGSGFGIRAELWPPVVAPGETCELRVIVTPAEGRHVYARTQDEDFQIGLPLELRLEAEGLELIGDWQESAPTRKRDEVMEVSYDVHQSTAVLTRRVRAPRDLDAPRTFTLEGAVKGMSCDENSCLPPALIAFENKLEVQPALGKATVKIDPQIGWGSHAAFSAEEAVVGSRMWLSVYVATPTPRHIYSMWKPTEIGFPTKITLTLPEGMKQAAPVGEPIPIEKEDPALGEMLYLHEGRVRFFVPIDITADTKVGAHEIQVQVEAMSCDDEGCLPPSKQKHQLKLAVKAS